MQIVFNKKSTDQLFKTTEIHNEIVRRRWRIFSIVLSLISGASIIILSQKTGKVFLSAVLALVVCGLLIPIFFRDFIPAFQMMPMRASFLYAAMMEKGRDVNIKIKQTDHCQCEITISAEISAGMLLERTFDMAIETKSDIIDVIVDLENDVVYLPYNK